MPTISMFYGLIIKMYYFDNQQHNSPHIHVRYQGQDAVIEIPTGAVLEGNLPNAKLKLVVAWIELRREELMADWELAVNGDPLFRIEPLK